MISVLNFTGGHQVLEVGLFDIDCAQKNTLVFYYRAILCIRGTSVRIHVYSPFVI